jgi:hypothetical protein
LFIGDDHILAASLLVETVDQKDPQFHLNRVSTSLS